MKKIKTLLFIVVVMILTAVMAGSCKKIKISFAKIADTTKLPAATQTGAHTFGCLVNGTLWVGYAGTGVVGGFNPSVQRSRDLNGNPYINISARQIINGETRGWMSLEIDSIAGIGVYNIYTEKRGAGFTSIYNPSSCNLYMDDNNSYKKGVVEITKYSENILSGTFNFKYKTPDCTDTMYITDGRFDLKLY